MNNTKPSDLPDIPSNQRGTANGRNGDNESGCSDVDDSKAVFDDYAALKPQYKGPPDNNGGEISPGVATSKSDAETCTVRGDSAL